MAKFTKTTEIDISAMHEVVEEITPKKSKLRLVLSIIISVVIAFIIWVAATEISDDTHKKTFVGVEVVNSEETIEVQVEGTYSALADIKKEHFNVQKINGQYIVTLKGNPKSVEVISPVQP